MAIQIHWQSDISGIETQQTILLLGHSLVLTMVGDVLIGSAWSLTVDKHRQSHLEWAQRLQDCLHKSDEHDVEIKLMQQGTAYSRAIWMALIEIPLGRTRTYSDLAKQFNSGPRAVAKACRNNPYPGIIPCHRVVSKSDIGGFMGHVQGPWVEFKRQLLSDESNIVLRRT